MKKKSVSSFIIKCVCLTAPFLAVGIFYFIRDPYMVIRHYKSYDGSYLFVNENYIGWQTYLNNRDSMHYNSFILGNSCTMAFKCNNWQKYLDKNDRAIRLFGNAERLSGVCDKMKALNKVHAPIKHILLITDESLLDNSPLGPSAMHILPPGESNISNFNFQKSFLQEFLMPQNLFSYIDYCIFHKYHNYMKGIINPYGIVHNRLNCDAINPHDKEIAKLQDRYWVLFKSRFPTRSGLFKEYPAVLNPSKKMLLLQIEQICKEHHADIKVIICPEYKQIKFNPTDFIALQQIFGKNNVYDFSGINSYTQNIHNFYEGAHFRPTLGDTLMQVVYGRFCRSNSKGSVVRNKSPKVSYKQAV